MAATAIIVSAPETEQAVERWRRQYTQDGADGMPPHVTLLYPFVDDSVLVAGQIRGLRSILAGFEPFEFALVDFAEFPASATSGPVLYLKPDPAKPFRTITEALVSAFPDYPPYGGEFNDIVPHLTIAEGQHAPFADIRGDVARFLPLTAHGAQALVMVHTDQGWRMKSKILLGVPEEDYREEPLFY